MANYTTTRFTATETIGDSVIGLNMINSGAITISPKQGYVVTASDFSISSLPTNIDSVTFADSTTAGQPGNTIIVFIKLGPLFTVSASTIVNLNISGDAKIYNINTQTTNINVKIIDNTNTNNYGSTTITAETGYTAPTTTSGGIATTSITGSITKNVLTKIATISIIADSNYYFETKPYLQYNDITRDNLNIKQTSVVKDSNKNITRYNYDIMFKDNVENNANSTLIVYNAIAVRTQTNQIKDIIYGSSQVSTLGETRVIKIYGDSGAQFDLTITKDSDHSSILNTNQLFSNADVFHPQGGIIKGLNATLPQRSGLFSRPRPMIMFTQEFPAGTDAYSIKIYPKGSTTLSSNLSSTITINQYANPVFTMTASAGTNYTITTSPTIRYIGRPNTDINKLIQGTGATTLPPNGLFSFTYVATKGGSGAKFTTHNNPSFSNTDSTASNWTNSVSADNGGTEVRMVSLKTTVNDETTPTVATITGLVIVQRFGNATVAMDLTTSAFLTIT